MMPSHLPRNAVGLAACVIVISIPALCGEPTVTPEWPQWRGTDRNGIVAAKLPATWPEKLTLRWEVKDVKAGFSAPLIHKERVYLQQRTQTHELLFAYRASDGTVVWKWENRVERGIIDKELNSDPSATPLIRDGKIYLHSLTGAVTCRDATNADSIWSRDLNAEDGLDGPEYGAAASPLFFNKSIIVPVGSKESGKIVAFNPANGETLWESPDFIPGYASPVVAKLGGEDQVLALGFKELRCLKKKDAIMETAWKYEYFGGGDGNIATPVVTGDGLIIITNEADTRALRVENSKPVEVWNIPHGGYMSSPVLTVREGEAPAEPRLYLHSGSEVLAVDPKTGKILTKVEFEGEYCTLVASGTTLFCLNQTRQLQIFDISKTELKKLASYEISEEDDDTWSHFAIVDDCLIVRTRGKLQCLSWNPEPPKKE